MARDSCANTKGASRCVARSWVCSFIDNALPAPRSDRALVTKLRSAFAQAVSADQAAVAALTSHWDAQKFKDFVTAYQAEGLGLRATSLRLGSRACADYFG